LKKLFCKKINLVLLEKMQQVDNRSRIAGSWIKYVEFLLDFVAVVLVSTDIVTDVLVILEFYAARKMTFFYFGVVILCCAQVSYLMVFYLIFLVDGRIMRATNSCRYVKVFFIMLCLAPFGQLLPLFIWIESHRLPWLDSWLDTLEWSNSGCDREIKEDEDPLRHWISSKIQKHGGFIVESLIEALPQSILQFVALLCYKNVTTLSLYSIISSMTSVAIRGVMVSYSLNRATFIFNIACFTADIFNIFSCFSWAFWDADILFSWTANSWHFELQNIYGQIWFTQMLCVTFTLGVIIALFLLTFLAMLFLDIVRRGSSNNCVENKSDKNCISQVLETSFILFVIIPMGFSMILICSVTALAVLIMVCQIFKLWPWCFAFTIFESEHIARYEVFYSPWINWLFLSPDSFDYERRLGVSFRILGRRKCLRFRSKGNDELSRMILKIPYDKLSCKVLRSDVLQMKSNTWEVCCGLPQKFAMSQAQDVTFDSTRRARRVRSDQWIWEQYFVYGYWRMCTGLVLYVLLPLQFISLLCSLVYPFLAFSKIGLDANYIQIILSLIYFLWLGIALFCFPVMYRYRSLIYAVPVQAIQPKGLNRRVGNYWEWDNPDIRCICNIIEKEYAMELNQIYIEQIVLHFFQNLAPMMMELIGPQRYPAIDREIYFLRDAFQYRDHDRLTIFELKNVFSTKVKADYTKTKLYLPGCGLRIPLLDSYDDDCAEAKITTSQKIE